MSDGGRGVAGGAFSIIWEFRVAPEKRAAFLAAYAADGTWAKLFARAKGFIAVELLHSIDDDCRFVTIDRWESAAAFEAFQAAFGADYHALDEQLEGIATMETRLGVFLG